jgi:succinoglycan biosynthesis protein ExoM
MSGAVPTPPERIGVCICTYRRPELLRPLLEALGDQRLPDGVAYEIVVVDNDVGQSARDVVVAFRARCPVDVTYHCEPEANIALARNRAVAETRAPWIAFIDDDEVPERDWLFHLYGAHRRFGADAVAGPVTPRFAVDPPRWVLRSRLCERGSFPTGTVMTDARTMMTGNILLSRALLGDGAPFEPRLGRTGGEDTDFFARSIAGGARFVWSAEARAYETIPAARLRRMYFLKRALLRGVSEVRRARPGPRDLLKSMVAVAVYAAALPVARCAGEHHFMRLLIKSCDHMGKLLAACGLEAVRERTW